MARSGFPSMTALLGLLAVAGYQNRDKLSEMLGNRSDGGIGMAGRTPTDLGGTLGGLLGNGQNGSLDLGRLLGGLTGGAGLGSLLGGGLSELNTHMRQNGQGEAVDSWVSTGPNRAVIPRDMEKALAPDVIDDLMEHTGLPRDELLSRLARELPRAVDRYTPHGRLPNDEDMRSWQG